MVEHKTVFEDIIDIVDHPIIAIETGCSFIWTEQCFTNLSSLNIIEYLVKPTNGALYSFDNDKDKMDICKAELSKRNMLQYFRPVLGDSVEMLDKTPFHGVSFVWLDSCEDSMHAVSEYNASMKHVNGNHVICVDDYGCPNSVKWQEISRLLSFLGYEMKQYDTPTGLIVGYKESK